MRYRRFFDAAIGQLKNERRYRIFANLERDTGALPRALYRADDGTSVPGVAWCMPCGERAPLAKLGDACPHCGSYQVQVVGGEEMRVRDITIAEAPAPASAT